MKTVNIFVTSIIFLLVILNSYFIYEKTRNGITKLEIRNTDKINTIFNITKLKLESYLSNLEDKIAIESYQQIDGFREIFKNPEDNEDVLNSIQNKINNDLSNVNISTMADSNGISLITDFDGYIGESCQKNLQNYAKTKKNQLQIHPNTNEYHFDIMHLYDDKLTGNSGIFFTSFKTEHIRKILTQGEENFGQFFLLLNKYDNLIEISSEGNRSQLARETHLLPEEIENISIQADVNDSLWTLTFIANNISLNKDKQLVKVYAAIELSGLYIICAFFYLIMIKKRKNYEHIIAKRMASLRSAKQINESILDTALDPIICLDAQCKISLFNKAAEKLFGFKSSEILGQTLSTIIPEKDNREHYKCIDNYIKTGENRFTGFTREVTAYSKDGTEVSVNIAISDTGTKGKFYFTAVLHDLTEIKSAYKKLKKLSLSDSLTGLANRRSFDLKLADEWRRSIRNESSLSLILIDIDYFKNYNDSYGHMEGDNCLKLVSKTLKESFNRVTDHVARYGGEEFVVILPNEKNVEVLAKKCLKNIEELKIIHNTSDISRYVTISMGINTVYPNKENKMSNFLKDTDKVLYKAKNSGRNKFVINAN